MIKLTKKVDSNSFDSSTYTHNSDIGKGFNRTGKVVKIRLTRCTRFGRVLNAFWTRFERVLTQTMARRSPPPPPSPSPAQSDVSNLKVDSNSFDSSTYTRNSDIGKGFNRTGKVVKIRLTRSLDQRSFRAKFGATRRNSKTEERRGTV
ncbi:uncharacterized protein HKW66_Vig0066910 [Vigna angularis]|uniref:Uncharacterized protein n=1 Tax=Phaseolus angularis TaxID=3914 RepID=A0A8T0KBQ0_PHAAN|nr:uncharacterized protein HKW66_Vig0066910 [Vigna angularis]